MKNTPFRLSKPAKHNDQKNRKNAAAQGNGTKSDAANASGLLFQPGYSLFRTLQFSKPDEVAKEQSPGGGRLKHADMTSGIRRRSLFTL